RNDLQAVVLKTFPAVSRYLQALQSVSQKSVFGARMTGSGACVFAAFESGENARSALDLLQPEYKGFVAQGLSRHPFS
ncbi:MAG: 4-(cytidine 5'-diphospho)-2-C-methyl-D-erythritol kinase, partial [Betaproteobacteria bacterium]